MEIHGDGNELPSSMANPAPPTIGSDRRMQNHHHSGNTEAGTAHPHMDMDDEGADMPSSRATPALPSCFSHGPADCRLLADNESGTLTSSTHTHAMDVVDQPPETPCSAASAGSPLDASRRSTVNPNAGALVDALALLIECLTVGLDDMPALLVCETQLFEKRCAILDGVWSVVHGTCEDAAAEFAAWQVFQSEVTGVRRQAAAAYDAECAQLSALRERLVLGCASGDQMAMHLSGVGSTVSNIARAEQDLPDLAASAELDVLGLNATTQLPILSLADLAEDIVFVRGGATSRLFKLIAVLEMLDSSRHTLQSGAIRAQLQLKGDLFMDEEAVVAQLQPIMLQLISRKDAIRRAKPYFTQHDDSLWSLFADAERAYQATWQHSEA
jgi:hypothetical protein